MSDLTNNKPTGQSGELFNVNETHNGNSTSLIDRELIEGTPFWLLGSKEVGYFAALGHHKLCENQKTKEEVLEYLNKNDWKVIICLIGIVMEKMKQDSLYDQYKPNFSDKATYENNNSL